MNQTEKPDWKRHFKSIPALIILMIIIMLYIRLIITAVFQWLFG
jgi:hypothetical protein